MEVARDGKVVWIEYNVSIEKILEFINLLHMYESINYPLNLNPLRVVYPR